MELTIKNKEELNRFFGRCREAGHSVHAFKGPAPEGSVYSDGDPITNPVNIGWFCQETGERVDIIYEDDFRN